MSSLNQEITLTIDGKEVIVPKGTTILGAAKGLETDIPTICYHEHTTSYGVCRMCVVEVEDSRLLQPACVAEAREGMKVHTRNQRVERSRRTILEMLDSAVNLEEAPEIQEQLEDYGADLERFGDGERRAMPWPIWRRQFCVWYRLWSLCRPNARSAQSVWAACLRGAETKR